MENVIESLHCRMSEAVDFLKRWFKNCGKMLMLSERERKSFFFFFTLITWTLTESVFCFLQMFIKLIYFEPVTGELCFDAQQ